MPFNILKLKETIKSWTIGQTRKGAPIRTKGVLGRTMVEVLAVLAIVGVLSISGLGMYRYAMDHYQANEILNGIRSRAVIIGQQRILNQPLDLAEFHFGSQRDLILDRFEVVAYNDYDAEAVGKGGILPLAMDDRIAEIHSMVKKNCAIPSSKERKVQALEVFEIPYRVCRVLKNVEFMESTNMAINGELVEVAECEPDEEKPVEYDEEGEKIHTYDRMLYKNVASFIFDDDVGVVCERHSDCGTNCCDLENHFCARSGQCEEDKVCDLCEDKVDGKCTKTTDMRNLVAYAEAYPKLYHAALTNPLFDNRLVDSDGNALCCAPDGSHTPCGSCDETVCVCGCNGTACRPCIIKTQTCTEKLGCGICGCNAEETECLPDSACLLPCQQPEVDKKLCNGDTVKCCPDSGNDCSDETDCDCPDGEWVTRQVCGVEESCCKTETNLCEDDDTTLCPGKCDGGWTKKKLCGGTEVNCCPTKEDCSDQTDCPPDCLKWVPQIVWIQKYASFAFTHCCAIYSNGKTAACEHTLPEYDEADCGICEDPVSHEKMRKYIKRYLEKYPDNRGSIYFKPQWIWSKATVIDLGEEELPLYLDLRRGCIPRMSRGGHAPKTPDGVEYERTSEIDALDKEAGEVAARRRKETLFESLFSQWGLDTLPWRLEIDMNDVLGTGWHYNDLMQYEIFFTEGDISKPYFISDTYGFSSFPPIDLLLKNATNRRYRDYGQGWSFDGTNETPYISTVNAKFSPITAFWPGRACVVGSYSCERRGKLKYTFYNDPTGVYDSYAGTCVAVDLDKLCPKPEDRVTYGPGNAPPDWMPPGYRNQCWECCKYEKACKAIECCKSGFVYPKVDCTGTTGRCCPDNDNPCTDYDGEPCCGNPEYDEDHPCECQEGYAEEHKCECEEGYADENPCECDPSYAAENSCECDPTPCNCEEGYAEEHQCECDSDYAAANPCECDEDSTACKCNGAATGLIWVDD